MVEAPNTKIILSLGAFQSIMSTLRSFIHAKCIINSSLIIINVESKNGGSAQCKNGGSARYKNGGGAQSKNNGSIKLKLQFQLQY